MLPLNNTERFSTPGTYQDSKSSSVPATQKKNWVNAKILLTSVQNSMKSSPTRSSSPTSNIKPIKPHLINTTFAYVSNMSSSDGRESICSDFRQPKSDLEFCISVVHRGPLEDRAQRHSQWDVEERRLPLPSVTTTSCYLLAGPGFPWRLPQWGGGTWEGPGCARPGSVSASGPLGL